MEKLFKLLVILSLFSSFRCANFLINQLNNITQESQLSQSVFNIINEFYTLKGPYFHVINSVSDDKQEKFKDMITEVYKNVEIANQIEDVKRNFTKQLRKRFSILIFADSLESFMNVFSKLSSSDFKFRRFLTVILIEEISLTEVETIFSLFWQKFITNVNLIVQHNNGTIDLLTFLPFNNRTNQCGDTTPVLINSFDNNLRKWKSNIFHPAKAHNMQKCPLIIGCSVGTNEPSLMARNDSKGNVEIYGIEKSIFDELSRQLNFNPKFEIKGSSPGLLFENGSASGEEC